MNVRNIVVNFSAYFYWIEISEKMSQ